MPSSHPPPQHTDTAHTQVPTKALSGESLRELALDLRWSWSHSADALWAELEPELWDRTHNPWVVLQTVSPARLKACLAQPEYRQRLQTLFDLRHEHHASPAWFQQTHPEAAHLRVAYFSMEFALSEALPIYSGGLGNVAGDQLKAACDLDVPVTGVGLLWQQGYFRQVLRADGSQEELYPYNDPGQLPIVPVRDASGDWLRLPLDLSGTTIRLRVWKVHVGRRELFLLDSNDPANPPAARAITSELYGGGSELRLQQELVLGIGGWRLLHVLQREPDVCHLNEGHAALAVLERARTFMVDAGCAFDVALTVTRAGNLFTTHTPVPAGFDRFAPELIEQYLGRYADTDLRISRRDLLSLGRQNPDDLGEPFNMAFLAIRGSGVVNGVSRLHGAVSRRLFQPLFPRWSEREVPVGHVTNGIHVPTWQSPAAETQWTAACGHECWGGTMRGIEDDLMRCASDADLWTLRCTNRQALVAYVNSSRECATTVKPRLDPNALTIGFARRFAPYKRPTLLLHSPERLTRLLTNSDRPVQLLIAGKAHPADQFGQHLIAEWIRFLKREDVQGRVVFIPDYDMVVAGRLVQGVDLWINTPRRPWEASGTSGMKVLVNGGLNLSELDGWWAEAHAPEVGWALGDGQEHDNDPVWDAVEAEALYTLLEREIAPAFYSRDANGVPTAWLAKMRASMARLTPRFSTNRVIREYTESYYLPAAAAYRKRAAGKGALGRELVEWGRHLRDHWHEARFGELRVETRANRYEFTIDVTLGGLNPGAVRVELFAEPVGHGEPVREAMTRGRCRDERANTYAYSASVPASRAADDYTPRVVPFHPHAAVPLDASAILWQR